MYLLQLLILMVAPLSSTFIVSPQEEKICYSLWVFPPPAEYSVVLVVFVSIVLLQTVVLKVGMSCQGCAGAVRRVLGKMEGPFFLWSCARNSSHYFSYQGGKSFFPFKLSKADPDLFITGNDMITGVESFDIDMKEQKVTVKGNVQPDAVLQTVSKTGKKTAFWEEAASAPAPAPGEPEAKPSEAEAPAVTA